MFTLHRVRMILVAAITLLALPATALADPISNPPRGSTRIQFFTVVRNNFFVIPANDEMSGIRFCSFDVTLTGTGWVRFRDYFDPAGNFVLEALTDHIAYTFTANGKSLSDLFVRTQKLEADNIITNPDGTITVIQTWAGHASLIHGVGADVGRVTFSVTVDPNTGQELDFQILEYAGQIGGFWSADQQTVDALCEQLAP